MSPTLKKRLYALFQDFVLLLPELLFQLHISALLVILLPRKVSLLSADDTKGLRLALIYSIGAIIAAIAGPIIGLTIDLTRFRRLWLLIGIIGDVISIFLLGFASYAQMAVLWFVVAFSVTICAVAWSGWISTHHAEYTMKLLKERRRLRILDELQAVSAIRQRIRDHEGDHTRRNLTENAFENRNETNDYQEEVQPGQVVNSEVSFHRDDHNSFKNDYDNNQDDMIQNEHMNSNDHYNQDEDVSRPIDSLQTQMNSDIVRPNLGASRDGREKKFRRRSDRIIKFVSSFEDDTPDFAHFEVFDISALRRGNNITKGRRSQIFKVSRVAFFGFVGYALGTQIGYIKDLQLGFSIVAFVMGLGILFSLLLGDEDGSSFLLQIYRLVSWKLFSILSENSKISPLWHYIQDKVSTSVSLKTQEENTMESKELLTEDASNRTDKLSATTEQLSPLSPTVPYELTSTRDVTRKMPQSPLTKLPPPKKRSSQFIGTYSGSVTSFNEDALSTSTDSALNRKIFNMKTLLRDFFSPFIESPLYRLLLLGNFMMHLGIDTTNSFMLYYFRDVFQADITPIHIFDLHLDAASSVAFLTPFIIVGSIASSFLFALLPDLARLSTFWVLLSSLLMITLPILFIFAKLQWFFAICVFSLLYGIGQGVYTCLNWIFAVECIQIFQRKDSQTLGLWQSCSIIARFISSLIGGFIIDKILHTKIHWLPNQIQLSYFILYILCILYFTFGGLIYTYISYQLSLQEKELDDMENESYIPREAYEHIND